MTFGHFVKYQVPLVFWVGIIFSLSAIPSIPSFKFPISPDKIGHVGIYFVLCLLARRAFYFQARVAWLRRNALIGAFVFTVIYGILDELHQLYVPGRWADIYDAAADSLGGLLFVGWYRWKYGNLSEQRDDRE